MYKTQLDHRVEEEINYIKGSGTLTVRQFRRIVYRDVYPGIDVEFVSKGNDELPVEYNFIVKPGADPSRIALDYQGANNVELKDGKVSLTLGHLPPMTCLQFTLAVLRSSKPAWGYSSIRREPSSATESDCRHQPWAQPPP